jgi:Tol biopolymer transport system component
VRLTTNPAADQAPDWSPDDTQLVFQSNRDGNIEIYVMNADGTEQTRLTDYPGRDLDPAWSPNGIRSPSTVTSTRSRLRSANSSS